MNKLICVLASTLALAGCAAVGIGSSLASAKILQEANWPELTCRAAELVAAARKARKS